MKKPTAFGKYFLLERINIGGMAEVFRAKAFGVEGFERLVAVKRILPSIAEDKEFIRMFIEEAKLAVQLNHANVAQIFDLGVVDGSYYIALEHVHGRDLRGIFERCRQIGEAMPVAQACFIAMKVCEGLDYAHNKRDQQGRELALVHRDVSPQNILVSFEGEVKLIDFGIAKAAGTGPKTQSGILKGKLSYMSPEQVRGLQVDRRSDVFSCGIVLYELLTGERLFVAESDYSTLEKVRNVEILPPSTYNRKIPDELERIVLKALTRDVEDRYPNAIDLHDELQAFVYTAGEFYSRKDLAGWMKKVFGKEIEEETAKLESYRQLKPPTPTLSSMPPPPASPAAPAASAPTSAAAAPTGPIASSAVSAPTAVPPSAPTTGPISAMSAMPTAQLPAAMQTPSLSAVTTSPGPIVLPPPTPTSLPIALPIPTPPSMPIAVPLPSDEPAPASSPVPISPFASSLSSAPLVLHTPVDLRTGDARTQRKSTQPPIATKPTTSPPPPAPQVQAPARKAGVPAWDDDDVETRIYDEDEAKHKSKRTNLPLQPPVPSSPGIALQHAGPAYDESFPQLSILPASQPAIVPPEMTAPRPQFPSGSNNGSSSLPPEALGGPTEPMPEPMFDSRFARERRPSRGRDRSGPSRAPSRRAANEPGDPLASFGARVVGARSVRGAQPDRPTDRRDRLTIALGVATVAAIAGITVILLSGGSKSTPPAAAPPAIKPAPIVVADPNTGFDLYVTPAGMTRWKLDGESRTDRLPSRVRGISPGTHTVQIQPPPGYMSQFQQVNVEPGKAPKVEIVLQALPGIAGVFDSNPPGAAVSLITDGRRLAIGTSPAKAPLDPRNAYQVLFEKPGYVSVNRPVTFTGGAEERIAVTLEKATPDKPQAPPPTSPPTESRPQPKPVTREPERIADDSSASDKPDKGQGVLSLGSKPPCEIYVDGNATALHTPQKDLKLPLGRHRITLLNTEFGIKDTFTVDIKSDAPEKLIKDYSDKLP